LVDLHTHTTFSDGELIPSELVRRAQVLGVRYLGIADHGDLSNLEIIVPAMVRVAHQLNGVLKDIRVIPGIELTHVPPSEIPSLILKARELGAQVVVVHGETLVEPVAPGTNRAAIEGGADILAHPGLITEEEVILAAERGVYLEISARKGHCLTNGHVAKLARKLGASLVLNTDAHAPGDLIDRERAFGVLLGAGLSREEALEVLSAGEELAKRLGGERNG